ncbi:MAG: hypothetical protein M3144_04825, partial [Actinomycetota bacterium]|nr:hypothetical protein [Actinomycetota bacterium]
MFTTLFFSVNPVTFWPLMPIWPLPLIDTWSRVMFVASTMSTAALQSAALWVVQFAPVVEATELMFSQLSEVLRVDWRRTPSIEAFWIVPPEPAVPVPVTVRPPRDPVFSSRMPWAAPADEMLLKLSPLAPMVVFWTLRALPVPLGWFSVLFDPVTLTVPPPVAEKACPSPVAVEVTPPVKLMVAPVLFCRLIPPAVFVVGPEKVTVPPVRSRTATPGPTLLEWEIVAAMLMSPLAAPWRNSSLTDPESVMLGPMSAVV